MFGEEMRRDCLVTGYSLDNLQMLVARL